MTNNELSKADDTKLRKTGHTPGDDEYEALGVFHHVTKPRLETVVTGIRQDGSTYPAGLDTNIAFFDLTYLDEPDEWRPLPIQPPAGYWWRNTRRLSVVMLSALGMMAILAICSVTTVKPPAWLLWVVLGAIVAPAIAAIVICVIAARPYRAERRLGYTTWPSGRELGKRR